MREIRRMFVQLFHVRTQKHQRRKEMQLSRTHEFSVVIERDEDGYYVASVPALPGCHTQAKSLDELMVRVKEAIELCLEVEEEIPSDLEFIGVQRIAISR